ncbi:MAG TPA: PilZ domain-containing protein [bacterium]|nr:PilZ domain-containing protein [bacterium]HQO34553.1 PilZ domain-containing protein [bacterium]HQP97149.1 PilZ domain-containing protein [bacterium]
MTTTGYEEKREFIREDVSIPFIYSLDEGNSLLDGEWREAVTLDIGPVLVGGIGFNTTLDDFQEGQPIRVALFMDLKLKEVWEREQENFPIIYNAKVLRVSDRGDHKRVALVFGGMISEVEE